MKFNKMGSVLLLASSVVSLAACGAKEAAKDIQASLENPDLIHTWENQHCSSSKIAGASFRVQFKFLGNDVQKTEQFYSSADCAELAGEITYSGTFEKKGEVQKDVNELNLKFDRVNVVAFNDIGKKILNTFGLCGKSDWEVNRKADLTTQSRDATCVLSALPYEVYDVYQVENDTLFFGNYDNTTAEKRPVSVDRTSAFRKI